MNWYDVINKENFVWNEDTLRVTSLLSPDTGFESSYTLHSSIFKIDKQSYVDFIKFLEDRIMPADSDLKSYSARLLL